METFQTFISALEYVWALPLGVGKLFYVAGTYYVGKVGINFLSDIKESDTKDKK